MNKRIQLFIVLLFASFTNAFAQNQNVTFQVENPLSTPVYVVGSWNGWSNWPGVQMTMVAPNKYSATVSIPQNTVPEFLFVRDSSGTPAKELLQSSFPCTNGNVQYTNRIFTLGTNDTSLCYTWATCNTCTVTTPPPPPTPKNVTFQVESPDSTPVHITGSWNWGAFPGTAMTMVTPTKYTATIQLMPSTTPYEFKFLNGASNTFENLLPSMPCTNGNAQYTNRVLTLGNNDTSLCYTWSTCNACTVTPPPPPPTTVNVTFQVESPDSTPVHVTGSWNWGGFPGVAMTMITPTKYSATIPLLPSTTPYEFKFVNGAGNTFENLLPSMSCTNGNAQYTNRVLTLGNSDTILCYTWATCNACTIAPPPTNINVKFGVKNTDSTPVYVFGNWNNWSNFPGTPLTLNTTNNTWEGTLPFSPNSTFEYLFVNGVGTKEVMDPAWTCTNGNAQYTNRLVTIGAADTTICSEWESCNACGTIQPPANVNIKFAVQAPDSLPVFVFGNWSNWSNFPGTPLTYNSATNAHEVVLSLPGNQTMEYLFVNGSAKEVLNSSAPCTNGNAQYTNRVLTVTHKDTSVCNIWQTCNACQPASVNGINKSDLTLLLSNNSIQLQSNTYSVFDGLEIYDITGKRIFNSNRVNANQNINVNLISNTLYIIKVSNAGSHYTTKAILNY